MSIKFYLRDEQVRRNLIDYINKQPVNADFPLVVSFADPKRTLPQNSLFHALCGDRQSIAFSGLGLLGRFRRGNQFWSPVTPLPLEGRGRLLPGLRGNWWQFAKAPHRWGSSG